MPPLTPLPSAANMRSFHTQASTHDQSRSCACASCLASFGTDDASLSLCLLMNLPLPPSCLPSLCAALLTALYHDLLARNLIGSLITCSTMEALTPAPVHFKGRSPRLLRHTFPSFRLQPRSAPRYRLLPLQRIGLLPGFATESEARRNTTPNRVRYPTDRQFASSCSPPRLAATQLPSATELWHTPTRTCTVLIWRHHGRTILAFARMTT